MDTEPIPAVMVVSPDGIDAAIGARSVGERVRFLRQQRILGRLVAPTPGRLTTRLRRGERLAGSRTVYCFVGEGVPHIRGRTEMRISVW